MKNVWLITLISISLGVVSCSKDDEKEGPVEATVYSVTFETDGGIPVPAVQQVKAGNPATVPATNPTKTGYVFMFWHVSGAEAAYNFQAPVSSDLTLYARWENEGNGNGGTDPGDYKMFTSIADMKVWLEKQYNSEETPYKVGLKGINLDTGNNWGDLGIAINTNKYIYVDLDLQGCTGTAIPDGYKSGNTTYGTFVNCDNLVSVLLPDGLKSIGLYAFYHCDKLASVILPEGVKSIGELAFGWCESLEGITLFTGLHSIDKKAFVRCSKLTYVTLPDGLMYIGEEAFWGCNSLEAIHIPKSIQAIGDDLFYSCDALAGVILPEGIQVIGNWFDFCKSLASITIPASVTSINSSAFSSVPLDEIILLSATPPSLGANVFKLKDVFDPASVSVTIKVPAGSVDAYKSASGWKVYAGKIMANNTP